MRVGTKKRVLLKSLHVPAVLGSKLDALPKNVSETTHIPLGIYLNHEPVRV